MSTDIFRGKSMLATWLVSSLLLTGSDWAAATPPACNTNAQQTGATAVLTGVGACANILGQGGRPMTDITAGVQATQAGTGVNWQAAPGVDVDYVIVRGQINTPCSYLYGNGTRSGQNLQAMIPANGAVATLTKFCSDGMLPKPPPVTTIQGCTGDAAPLQTAVNGNPTYQTVVGIGQYPPNSAQNAGNAQLAICAPSMTECDNQCWRPANYPANTHGDECVPDLNGALPLSCRACELATVRAPMRGRNFCWELTHHVNAQTGTFVPVRVTQPGDITWQSYEGSRCLLLTTHVFGNEFSYYSPTSCGAGR